MPDPKHPRDMTDAEFAAALKERRNQAPAAAKPAPEPATEEDAEQQRVIRARRRQVAAMTDAEFNAAVRQRPWRQKGNP